MVGFVAMYTIGDRRAAETGALSPSRHFSSCFFFFFAAMRVAWPPAPAPSSASSSAASSFSAAWRPVAAGLFSSAWGCAVSRAGGAGESNEDAGVVPSSSFSSWL